jgi:hypothetical protein
VSGPTVSSTAGSSSTCPGAILASSDASIDAASVRRLGQFLTGTEAKEIADRLSDGDTLTAALRAVSPGRRAELRSLLGQGDRGQLVAVLRAVEGARSITKALDSIWTMPGHLAQGGPLTSSATHLVGNARQSVTCSTFNFQRSSGLWAALRDAARRPEIAVRVYVDTRAADREHKCWSPTTSELATHLHPGTVLRTMKYDGATSATTPSSWPPTTGSCWCPARTSRGAPSTACRVRRAHRQREPDRGRRARDAPGRRLDLRAGSGRRSVSGERVQEGGQAGAREGQSGGGIFAVAQGESVGG